MDYRWRPNSDIVHGIGKKTFDLSGKVAIITGGTGLLGQKHAEALAEFGAIPILLDIEDNLGKKYSKKFPKNIVLTVYISIVI